MDSLAEQIISGARLGRRDDLGALLETDLEELCRAADQVRRALCGDRGELCTIVNGRSGRCSEDCRFCAQSCHYHTGAEEYPFLPVQEIVEEGKRNEAAGVHRYSIVTAGRGLHGRELDHALEAYRRFVAGENTLFDLTQWTPAPPIEDGDSGENPGSGEEDPQVPQTGDASPLVESLVILGMSAAGLCAAVWTDRKRKSRG